MREKRLLDALLLGSDMACVIKHIKKHNVAREVPGLDRIKTLEQTVWIFALDLPWYNREGVPHVAMHDAKKHIRNIAKQTIAPDPDVRRYMPIMGEDQPRADRFCPVHGRMWRDCRC